MVQLSVSSSIDADMDVEPSSDMKALSKIDTLSGEYSNSNSSTVYNSGEDEEYVVSKISPSCYFNDGKKVIDLVLAYQPNLRPRGNNAKKREILADKYRRAFERKLRGIGLCTEHEGIDQSQDGKTCFVKIHGTWDFLARNAERLGVKVALSEVDILPSKTWFKGILSCWGLIPNPFRLTALEDRPMIDYYAMTFDRRRLECYDMDDKETFWSRSQRIRLVDHEVQRTAINRITLPSGKMPVLNEIDDSDPEEALDGDIRDLPNAGPIDPETMVTFQWLLRRKIYHSAFCLHDSDLNDMEGLDQLHPSEQPMRIWLRSVWGNWNSWNKYQPMDHIYEYFGAEIALYFAWLGFYTQKLILPSILSIFCLIWGFVTLFKPFVRDICEDGRFGNATMCRKCPNPGCPYTLMNTYCSYARFATIFDNPSTLFFATFISIWAVFFLEFWKRYEASLAAKWGTDDAEEDEVMLRPEYQFGVKARRINPVTGIEESYLPTGEKVRRMGLSISASALFILVLLVLTIGIIAYRSVGLYVWYRIGHGAFAIIGGPSMVTSLTASCLNGLVIAVMSMIFPNVAWKLTEFEYPRTQQEFNDSYIYKMLIFEFINYYGTIFYLAFIKGKFNDVPYLASKFDTQCPPSGCMTDVCIQLMVVMTGKQIIQNFKEVGLPMLKNYLRRRTILTNIDVTENPFSQWEKDFILEPVQSPIAFADYLEMVIQYGFLTMFAPAFPIAFVFALLNNIFEIRIDAIKSLTEYRLPIPMQVPNIGSWGKVLEAVTRISVVINAFIIAFTSEVVDKLVYFLESGNFDEGYLNNSMTAFFTKDYMRTVREYSLKELQFDSTINSTVEICYFRSYVVSGGLAEEYTRRSIWWKVMLAKVTFVVVFEHAVFFIQNLFQNLIPDVPQHIQLRQLREQYLVKKAFIEAESHGQKKLTFSRNASERWSRRRPSEAKLKFKESSSENES